VDLDWESAQFGFSFENFGCVWVCGVCGVIPCGGVRLDFGDCRDGADRSRGEVDWIWANDGSGMIPCGGVR